MTPLGTSSWSERRHHVPEVCVSLHRPTAGHPVASRDGCRARDKLGKGQGSSQPLGPLSPESPSLHAHHPGLPYVAPILAPHILFKAGSLVWGGV